jgi:branched-subunit amino acid transport protein
MSVHLTHQELSWALLAAALGTYAWRGLGVALSGRVNPESEFFRWLSAVTYAMVAALTLRMLILPVGLLAQVSMAHRFLACALALGVMLSRPQRLLIPALLAGSAVIVWAGYHMAP